ncbi:MAG: gyrase inhibitor YacG [Myxococcales bacterium]|nr:gyrase inhibitor YacG [Myxococcales bacterium]
MTARPTRCPTCKKPATKDGNKLFPFCSERCHLLDLGRWLNEDYRVPEAPESAGGAAPSSSPSTDEES